MVAKYYIYASGRWCEVETRRGRVSGWRQRARFCFLRGGRLEVARSAPVLRALRSLASGTGSAARDAAPLPYSRRHRPRRESVAPAHVCCAHHLHHSRCDLNANELGDKPPPTQAVASPRKRKRSTSEEQTSKAKQAKSELASKAAKQVETVQKKKADVSEQGEEEKLVQILLQSGSEDSKEKQKRSPLNLKNGVLLSKDQKSVQNSPSSSKNGKEQKNGVIRSKEEEMLVQSLLQTSSSDETGDQQKKPQGKLNSSSEDARKQSQESPQKVKLPRKQVKKVARSKQEEKLVQSLLQSSSSEDGVKEQAPKLQTARRSKPKHYKSDSSSVPVRKDGLCKELIIDESDVDMLRNFMSKTVGRTELDRFDKDEKYKTRVFYKLNPLVTLQRCKSMEQLLLQRLTLKEFARHLGLRSVADVTPEKRYRMRHSTRQARHVTSESESESDKETVPPKRRQLWNRDKEVFNSFRSSRSSEVKDKPQIPKPASESSPDSSDSDTEVKKNIRRNLERRTSTRLNPGRDEKTIRGKEVNDSVVVSDESDSDEGPRNSSQTRAKETDKKNESVVLSDDSNENQRKSRRRSRAANATESVVVNVDTDSDSDENRRNTRRTRTANKTANNESVVVSDESESDTDNNRRSSGRTRSQGPEKRVLRERNKSLVISDDTDSKIDENQVKYKSKAKAPETARVKTKSAVVSDESSSNTDENQKTSRRTRSKGPDGALKENNNDSNKKKDTDNKTKKEVDINKPNRTTRSSMKGGDDDSMTKEVYKTQTSKKDQPSSRKTETKRKEDKPANKEVTKESKKADAAKDQEKSVISDSDNAFETSKASPKKQRRSFGDLIRNINGRFLKKKEDIKSNEKHRTGDKNNEVSKASEKRISKEKDDKDGKDVNEKHKLKKFSKQSKTQNHVMENGTDRKGNKSESKVSEKLRTEKYEMSRGERHRTDKEKDKERDKNERKNENSAAARMFVKPVKFKKSCVANGREYTSLEDHAIVAWVSVGGRERSVNGNAIWRELQQEYPKLTSQTRSWHSLRNRYLRYILPALPALALPPAQVSRLRAAAATGKLKSRPGYRRNSIFSAVRVRSAAAVARRPVRDSDSDNETRERTPPPRRARLVSPSKLSSPSKPPSKLSSPSKSVSIKSSSSNKSPSKNSPPSKAPSKKLPSKHSSPSKRNVPPSPSKRVTISPKRGGPSSPRTSRLRLRPSSTPTPQKKRRVHHL